MADNSGSSYAAASVAPKQRTLDKWIEPSLPAPVPSYQDRPNLNISAVGVLTSMAPLGTLPTSKMQKIAKTDTNVKARTAKNGGASASSVSTPMEGTITPDPMPTSNMRRSESHKEEDIDYHPLPVTPSPQRIGGVPLMATNGAGPSFMSPQRTLSQHSYAPLPTRQPLSAPRPTSSSMFASSSMPRPPPRLEQVVLSAIRSARGAGRQHTAFALTDLITNQRDDPNVERVLRAVATSGGNISPELFREFSVMVQQKKRESRRKGLAERRESTFAGSGIRFATPSYNSPSKAPAVSETIPPQLGASGFAHTSSSMSMSPQKEDAHVSKKLKPNNYQEDGQAEPMESSSHVNGSHDVQPQEPPLQSSPPGSPLSELDDVEDPFVQTGGDPTTTMEQPEEQPEEHATIAEIKERVKTSNKRRANKAAVPKLRTARINTSNGTAAVATPSPSSGVFPPNINAKANKKATGNVDQKLDPNDPLEIRRRQAREITLNHGVPYHESHERRSRIYQDSETESEGRESSTAITRPAAQRLRLRNNPKGVANDDSEKSSPTFLSFQHDLAPSSTTNSRQSTPNPYGRPMRKTTRQGGPRVKSSPMKNRNVPLAGISRASGDRNSPIGNGGFGGTQDFKDHDDFCNSCSGLGTIVVCEGDGCKRSYHFLCLDPPREDVEELDSFYCNSCTASMKQPTRKTPGLFGPLLDILDRTNPKAFALTKDIAEYFEGVKVGPLGEYEEILPISQRTKNRAGYEEDPDYLRLRDNKGNFILCHQCQRSAASGQAIIGCSYCSLHWHLDCLDPPMSKPPSKERAWKCPCHTDDLLDKVPGMLGPAHKHRKIKGASATRARGARNNGHIEVDNSASEGEEEASGFYRQNVFGKEYRIPAQSIKLDFITRLNQDRMRSAQRAKTSRQEFQSQPVLPGEPLNLRPVREQQAVLNLHQLAKAPVDFRSPDQSSVLIQALITGASDEVVTLIAQADANNLERRELAPTDIVALRAFRASVDELINKMDKLPEQPKINHTQDSSAETLDHSPTTTQQSADAVATKEADDHAVTSKEADDNTEMLL